IDSSHIIRTGGDVVFLYLELLPSLPSGILVHAHDIFLPFEYPERFILEDRCGWNEQYLVAALLYGGTALEVLWPSCFMWTRDREFVKSVIPSEREFPPSSLWFRVGK
ncbi:MAG: class I SAM-dependent methyltransferase, partial [Acidobacteria bacterium]|nr:class I SAM-dependent methyltransferase [Acidobacteriota bacterium]